MYPSTPHDAKWSLLACIEDDNPCIFFEPMRLSFSPGPVPEDYYTIPLGTAQIRRLEDHRRRCVGIAVAKGCWQSEVAWPDRPEITVFTGRARL